MRRSRWIEAAALSTLVIGWTIAGCGGNTVQETPCGTCAENAECVETVEGPDCRCKTGYMPGGNDTCIKLDDKCPTMPPPTTPTEPKPTDGTTDRGVSGVSLGWYEPAEEYRKHDNDIVNAPSFCDDTRRSAATKYDVYLGTTADPPLLKKDVALKDGGCTDSSDVCISGFTEKDGKTHQMTGYKVTDELKYGSKYYWKIVVKRTGGASATSPVWSFTTKGDIRCAASPTVTDKDGNKYDTVQIGSQCWMNANLAVGKLTISSQTDNNIAEKNCYKGDGDPDCPGLYIWNELMNHGGGGSLCPAGWHVPTVDEWKLLINHADFKRFDPQYQGYKATSNRSFGSLGGYYWTSDEKTSGSTGSAYVIVFYYYTLNKDPELTSFNKSSNLLSARCVKN